MIFLNFKTYKKGTGRSALELATVVEGVVEQARIKIIPVVQTVDLREVASLARLEVWVQKIDAVDFGAHTGSTLPEAVYEAGARGTFLNHSESKIGDIELLGKFVDRATEAGLKTLVFASGLEELKKVLALKPSFVSYEPPELIGSRRGSVVSEKPEVVSAAVELSRSQGIPLVVGAGIHSGEDIRSSLKLGASGFAVSSDILKAEDPRAELMDLVEGYK